MLKFINKKKKGFTLIELLIVITIIGILAVIFLPSMLGAPAKARDVQRMADVKKIAAYALSIGSTYPYAWINPNSVYDFSLNIKANLSYFGGKFPSDPVSTNCFDVTKPGTCGSYLYFPYSPNSPYKFGIFAKVENKKNGNFNYWRSAVGADTLREPLVVTNGTFYGILIQK
ncbi:MAG: type II secretion system protein [Candidatus Gracilibacteria bacterium]